MTLSSIGDMRQHFLNVRNNASLRGDLNTLVQELTTGLASDLTAHLGASQTRLSSIDRQLDMTKRFAQANLETAQMLSTMQTALSSIETHRGSVSSALLTIDNSSSQSQIGDAANIARSGFEATIQSLNVRYGDRAIFGGNNLDSSPLTSADSMFDALETVVAGLTTADSVRAAVDTWFDAPAGGFETIGYQGDATGFLDRTSESGQSLEIGVRADDDTLREMMKFFALGALAGGASAALNLDERQNLQQQAGVDLLSIAVPFASVQARLGYVEGQIEEASVRLSAQEASLSIAHNDLVTVDPFETATKLEQVQIQLETHYTITARLSRLSLTEYLR